MIFDMETPSRTQPIHVSTVILHDHAKHPEGQLKSELLMLKALSFKHERHDIADETRL